MKSRVIGRLVVALSTVIVALAVSHGGTHAGIANAASTTVTPLAVSGGRRS